MCRRFYAGECGTMYLPFLEFQRRWGRKSATTVGQAFTLMLREIPGRWCDVMCGWGQSALFWVAMPCLWLLWGRWIVFIPYRLYRSKETIFSAMECIITLACRYDLSPRLISFLFTPFLLSVFSVIFSSLIRLFYTASNRRPCLRFCLVTVSCSYSLVVSWMTIRCHPSSVSVRHIFNSIHFQAAPPLLRTRWARSTSLWPDWTGPSRDWAPLTLRYSSYPPSHHITSHQNTQLIDQSQPQCCQKSACCAFRQSTHTITAVLTTSWINVTKHFLVGDRAACLPLWRPPLKIGGNGCTPHARDRAHAHYTSCYFQITSCYVMLFHVVLLRALLQSTILDGTTSHHCTTSYLSAF